MNDKYKLKTTNVSMTKTYLSMQLIIFDTFNLIKVKKCA